MTDRASPAPSAEEQRLADDAAGRADWRLWGTYLPERQWGTVREDYSADGDPWAALSYDASRAQAYRWGEDGLLGWTDRECRLCFSLALWNGQDPHLKDKLFGLTNDEGNHGEDVKELYHYVDATPTGSYARALYRYPQAAFPYRRLVDENRRRGPGHPEYELLDTGVFDGDRYFDVTVEYAKRGPDDVLIRLTVANRGDGEAAITLLPTLTFRNTWSWDGSPPPRLHEVRGAPVPTILAHHDTLGTHRFLPVGAGQVDEALFTGNDSNLRALGGGRGGPRFTKDAFHRYVADGEAGAVDPARQGTKAAFLAHRRLPGGGSFVLRLRLVRQDGPVPTELTPDEFDACCALRISEADAFYAGRLPAALPDEERAVARQAFAGLLWGKQVYIYDVKRWLDGDPAQPGPPPGREEGRNAGWRHLRCLDVISMPDKWEYPWFAAWDLAFHAIPLAEIDPAFAKAQLLLMLSERYLHPNGALPAYEYGFGDANPPVHAAAVWQVYEVERRRTGQGDTDFLEKAFLRLLLNFTWWVNRHDPEGKDLFGGGFLGLDNIGLFDRNAALPGGATLTQADATAWMGLFCTSMHVIAVELAQTRPVHQDMVVKFSHHFMLIVDAINSMGGTGLWDEETGFFYDQVMMPGRGPIPLKVQSIVGLVPLFAIGSLRQDQRAAIPDAMREIEAGLAENPERREHICTAEVTDGPFAGAQFVSLVPKERMLRVLERVLDEQQFLSPYGVRSVSKRHRDHPFTLEYRGVKLEVGYVPGEGTTDAFGGNSNWRGPVWFPVNVLLIHALQRYHDVHGDTLTVECPVGSGQRMTLGEVAQELARRLVRPFLPDADGRRPCHGDEGRYATDPGWRGLVLFNEYFHADTGRGLGASHQTGWTGTVATCLSIAAEAKDDRRAGRGSQRLPPGWSVG